MVMSMVKITLRVSYIYLFISIGVLIQSIRTIIILWFIGGGLLNWHPMEKFLNNLAAETSTGGGAPRSGWSDVQAGKTRYVKGSVLQRERERERKFSNSMAIMPLFQCILCRTDITQKAHKV